MFFCQKLLFAVYYSGSMNQCIKKSYSEHAAVIYGNAMYQSKKYLQRSVLLTAYCLPRMEVSHTMLAIFLAPLYILINIYIVRWMILWMGACTHFFLDLCVPGMLCRCLYFFVHFSSDLFFHPEATCAPSLPEKYGKLFSGNISLHPDRNRNYRSLQTDPEAYASSGLDVFQESLRSHRRCLHPSDHWCQSLWDF